MKKSLQFDKMAIIAIVFVTIISGLSYSISRLAIEQEKPGKDETLRLANQAYDRGDFQGSSFLYKRYLDTFDSKNISVMIDYGYSLHNIGKSSDGIDVLRKVLLVDPSNAFALFNIAVIYYRDGNKTKAKEWMQQCVDKGNAPDIVEKAKALLEQM